MKQQMITQWLPQTDTLVKVLIFGYVFVLLFTYPLTIYPTNEVIERLLVEKMLPKSSTCRKWTKNLSRVMVCFTAAYLGIEMREQLDILIGVLGALFCAPLAMIIPTMCHLILIAKEPSEKLVDIAIIGVSGVIMVFCVN